MFKFFIDNIVDLLSMLNILKAIEWIGRNPLSLRGVQVPLNNNYVLMKQKIKHISFDYSMSMSPSGNIQKSINTYVQTVFEFKLLS